RIFSVQHTPERTRHPPGAGTGAHVLCQCHTVSKIRRAPEALAQAGLAGFEDVPVAQLSAGQQRRVALARLWLTRAALWVLDEPFTAIDVNGVARLTRRMAAHTAQGGMVILTTHQPLPGAADTVRRLVLTGGGAGL
ncbi:ATP-binding cassette domain-containing protein, partial [Salmonella enterica subsp. enterica serovar Anatum]|nr:ATP-binding cassette domain-containing protein [Salmonella enterica subsp. enterica serovar Anatum]